jgi:hypothetical protein
MRRPFTGTRTPCSGGASASSLPSPLRHPQAAAVRVLPRRRRWSRSRVPDIAFHASACVGLRVALCAENPRVDGLLLYDRLRVEDAAGVPINDIKTYFAGKKLLVLYFGGPFEILKGYSRFGLTACVLR